MPAKEMDANSLVARAREQEKKYDWQGAAQTYQEAVDALAERKSPRIGDLLERKAYAVFRGAFQTNASNEFGDRLQIAIDDYGRAKEAHGLLEDPAASPKGDRCDAMIAYMAFWCSKDAQKKKTHIYDAWNRTIGATKKFHTLSMGEEYCRTFHQLALAAQISYGYEGELRRREKIMRELLAMAKTSTELVSEASDPDDQARTYVAACFGRNSLIFDHLVGEEFEKNEKAACDAWQKARELSEQVFLTEVMRNALYSGAPIPSDQLAASKFFDRAVAECEKSQDKFAMGVASDWIAQRTYSSLAKASDSEEMNSAAQKALGHSLAAKNYFATVNFTVPQMAWAWPSSPHLSHYDHCAHFEHDIEKKRQLAERAIEYAPELIELASRAECPDVVADSELYMCRALTTLAKGEKDTDKKRSLLERALKHGLDGTEAWEVLHPANDATKGWSCYYVAEAESELAILANEPEQKVVQLRESFRRRKRGLEFWSAMLSNPSWQEQRYYALGGLWHAEHGAWIRRLYELSGNSEDLQDAAKTFEGAVRAYHLAGQPSRCAENYWQAADAYGGLGEHLKSAERFSQAAECFEVAAEKLPLLKNLYRDHSTYMKAWARLEHAKHHHFRQEHDLSRAAYEEAAALFGKTKAWSVFSTNYSAWSWIEKAEELSRADDNEQSARAFEEAAKLFRVSQKSIRSTISSMEDGEVVAMAAKLVRAADLRRDYCSARAAIEKARILDKGGKESASAENYAEAASILEKVHDRLEADRDKVEIRLALTLTKAWQKMAEAEATVSPKLFGEASVLFEEAKELSPSMKAKLLASGHCRFCKALEAGMLFSDTGDPTLHTDATKHLESAAKYYLRAGFQNASEYANASKLLFDGYVQMDKASREEDQSKRARLYTLAEKILEASASSFEAADYIGKKDQTLKLLAKVRRDKELAVSLTKALSAPDIVSATSDFSFVAPTYERAVGAERFEHANIQATMLGRPRSLHIGDEFSLEIELVNAGRGSAQLTKVEDMIPHGFEVRHVPEKYRIEDSYLNMRGRRLDPLKTEDVKVVLKPTVQGCFKLKPRIMYLDDSGKYKYHEPEPMEVTVTELGLSGWLKGPDKTR